METEPSFFRSTADRFLMLPSPVLWTEKLQMSVAVKVMLPPGCWHGDNCPLVHCLFYSRLLGGAEKICSLSQACCVLSLWKGHCAVDERLTYLNEPIPVRVEVTFSLCSLSLCSGYLVLQATLQIPAGILARPLMRLERRGPSKCAAKFASPAQWDTRCTALQRGFASPTGPGRGDSRSANVSEIWNVFVMQMSPRKLRALLLDCNGTEIFQVYTCFTLLTMW